VDAGDCGSRSPVVTERAWELPAAGVSLRQRWEAIASDLAGHVTAVGYDADSGQLTVCPESAVWATKVRLEQARIIEAANAAAGRTVVRALRILPPGAVPAPDPADVAPGLPAAPTGPARTRETACEGYRRALARTRRPRRRAGWTGGKNGGAPGDLFVEVRIDWPSAMGPLEAPAGRGRPAGAVCGGVRRAVASRREAPWGFSRTIVPMGYG